MLILTPIFVGILYSASLTSLSLLISALAPSFFLMFYFYIKDKYEPEPRVLIIRVFTLGFLMAVPAAIIESFVVSDGEGMFRLIIDYFLGIALVEELLKFSAFYFGAYRKSELNEPMDGIIYSVAAALGFATIENIAYVAMGGIFVAAARAILAVPGHALFGATIGYYSGLAKFDPKRERSLHAKGILLATIYHGLYNLCVTLQPILLGLVVAPMMIWLAARVKKSILVALELSPHKTSSQTKSRLLAKLEKAYQNGRISKATYEEIKKRLNPDRDFSH